MTLEKRNLDLEFSRELIKKVDFIRFCLVLLVLCLGFTIFYVNDGLSYMFDRLADSLKIPTQWESLGTKYYNDVKDFIIDFPVYVKDGFLGFLIDLKEKNISLVSIFGSIFTRVLLIFSIVFKYFLQFLLTFGFMVYVFFSFYLSTEHKKNDVSILGKVYLWFCKKKVLALKFLKNEFNDFKEFFRKNKFICFFTVFIVFFPYVVLVAYEIIVFIVCYLVSMFTLTSDLYLLKNLGSLLVFALKKWLDLSFFFKLVLMVLVVFVFAVYRGRKKLRKNFINFKLFVSKDLSQTTIINGVPGSGKTLTLTSAALASEEYFHDLFENEINDYTKNYPLYDFSALDLKILNSSLDVPDWDSHKGYIMLFLGLYKRDSIIFSNYPIKDVYHDIYTRVFKKHDLELGVFDSHSTYDLEDRCVIAIAEFDKFCNSHDKGKEYFENGINIYFSTISHALHRDVKVFVDYQLKDQVPLMCRGNAEYKIKIYDRKEKYPFLLSFFYGFFVALDGFLLDKIERFYYKKDVLFKKSNRSKKRIRKRFDITFIIMFFSSIRFRLIPILNYFKTFVYWSHYAYMGDEDNPNANKIKYNLNMIDMEDSNKGKLYDSTYLAPFYEKMRELTSGSIINRNTWKDLNPSLEELKNTGLYERFFKSGAISTSESDNKILKEIEIL